MATVTLYQPTDMSALPTSIGFGQLGSPSGTDGPSGISIGTLGGFGLATCLGSFTIDAGGNVSGTLTRALIDDGDSDSFPNLDITGLSYQLSPNFFLDVFDAGNFFDFTAALLAGADTIVGSPDNDRLLGFDGNDTLIGGAGADVLDGGAGINTASYLTAASGLLADLDDSEFDTGDAKGDTYISIQNLAGSPFADTLYGDHGDNRLSGGAGNDILVGEAGADTFDGGPGSDTVAYDASAAGVRADLLNPATNTGDAAGDSYISIENLDGSSFDDILFGDNNANVIGGNLYHATPSGNDQLFGRGGNDSLFGYDGNDILDGGLGADTMTGGTGNDTYFVDNPGDKVVEAAGGGSDSVRNSISYTLTANVENLILSGAANINGNGNAAANVIRGNPGRNVLDGGAGKDTLTGGPGRDVFVFDTPLNATSNVDHITDFLPGTDTIRLAHADFDALAPGALPAGAFYANPTGAAAHATGDRIVYDAATGGLHYDANGSSPGGSTHFATLTPHLALTPGDFFIV